MPFPFYDRIDELSTLNDYCDQVKNDCSRMVVLTGRRRIGKTTLANRAFANCGLPYLFFFISGEKSEENNLESFWSENSSLLGLSNLPAAFSSFAELLEFLLIHSQNHPLVLVMDEFQNCTAVAPTFFSDLQRLWDKYRKNSQMLLVLTGSVASAMRQIIENPHAPLFGRKSGQIQLRPFTTTVVKQVLSEHFPSYEPEDLITLYAVTGGIPQYLEQVIEARCFKKESIIRRAVNPDSTFVTEAELLFRTEFKSDYTVYFEILQKIASGKTKRYELVSSFHNQTISGQLYRLESFFNIIERQFPVGSKTSKDYRFKISDDYILFWFKFIFPAQGLIQQRVTNRLVERVIEKFPDYVGRHVLETWFRRKLWETGLYSEIGPWWDRKGENEIDIVAVNEFDKELLFVEVKRQRKNIDLDSLAQKAYTFMSVHNQYKGFSIKTLGWSLDDL